MNRLTAVIVVLALGGPAAVLAGCGSSKSSSSKNQAKKDCPKNAPKDASYSGKFEGPQSMDQSKHVLQVTRNGRPVSGASVCVNTAMVGMSSMHYTATASKLGPGRYEAGFKFEMDGTYRGNVVTKEGGRAVSIPVSVTVSK